MPTEVRVRRPPPTAGTVVLAAACLVYGLQSLADPIRTIPFWLAAAPEGYQGSAVFMGAQVVSGTAALLAAYGLWHRRRWARVPFLLCLLLGAATLGVVMLFGGLGADSAPVWVVVTLFAVGTVVIAAWLTRYVWRVT